MIACESVTSDGFLLEKGSMVGFFSGGNQRGQNPKPFNFNNLAFQNQSKMAKNGIELLTYETDSGDLSARRFIRDGIAGNYDVVFEMVRIIRNSNKDYRIKNIAAELLKERGLNSYNDGANILRIIFNYVRDNVSYIQDIAGSVESVKSAYRTLSDKYGDCDDMTVTVCSLAGVLGFEKTAIALAKYSANDASFSHVYPVVYYNEKRYVLDTSLPDAQFNNEVKPFEVREIFPFETVQGLDGLSGIWTNTKTLGKKLAGAAIETLPNAVNYMPLGFLSSSALAGGAQLFSAATKKQKTLSETASEINKHLDGIIHKLVNNQIALDLAQSYATQYVSQLSLIEGATDNPSYKIIRASINEKLQFIKQFETIAKQYGFKVTYLNPNAMLLLGAGAASYGAYKLFRYFTKGKE